jgi:ribosomal-protein-alanine N-acetyltransferase
MIPKIRPAQDQDFPAIYAIEQEQKYPWSDNILQDCFQSDYENYVILADEKIVGFILQKNNGDESEIMNIAIAKAFQRKGYGELLLRYILNAAVKNKKQKIFLEVRASNFAAQALYKKMGFTEINIRKAYYYAVPEREDAIVMESGVR